MKMRKKQVSILTGILVLMIVLVNCMLLIRKDNISYSLQAFERNEICSRRLNMYYGETEQIDLGMEEAIYDEEIANEYLKKIANDIKTLEKKFEKPLNQPIKVYIIQKSLDTGMYIGGDAIYCTAEDIESNRYRLGLVRACYNLTEPAIIHGLVGYIFEEEVDLHKLSEYYDTAEDLSMLGLFGGRFYEEWNTEEELQIAKETATALVSYFIEQDREELILSGKIGLNEKKNG